MNANIQITMLNPIAAAEKKKHHATGLDPLPDSKPTYRVLVTIAVAILLTSCAAYGPYHANTSSEPLNSVRGPKDGRYKLAFIEFGDQGSALDTSQRTAALQVIHQAKRPLLFVYIHGWQNNANSGDVCRFEHFLDTVSQFPEVRAAKGNVVGVYIAWRGIDITLPVAKFLTFWSRKATGDYKVVPLGDTTAPPNLMAKDNRAVDANVLANHPDYSFYTSEHNDGHEDRFCANGNYNPDEVRPPSGKETWRRWQFVFTGNARVPCWIVRVPKEIIWGHGGLWSDNSVAMLAALLRIHFPLNAEGKAASREPRIVPGTPDVQQLNQDKPR